jgi:hypothetical protein
LEKYFQPRTIFIVLAGIVFGTNLFHYATYDAIFSHGYSFFLFSLFLHLIFYHIYSDGKWHHFVGAGVVAGLIIDTRVTNGLFLMMGLLVGVTSMRDLTG